MAVKTWLQEVFEIWGKPQRIRVDNGHPWGTNSRVPSALALWLAGLGVELVYGRPARSTDNAIVERSHGVLDKWVVPSKRANLEHLQDRLDWAVHLQRERYRSPHHLTRQQAYPDLFTNDRVYRRQQDAQQWQQQQAAHYLSRYTFERKVEKSGQISLFAQSYSVGKIFARQWVSVQLNPDTYEWLVYDQTGHTIQHFASRELDYQHLSRLQLSKRSNIT